MNLLFQNQNYVSPDFTPQVDVKTIETKVEKDRLDAKNIITETYYEFSEKPYAIDYKVAFLVSSIFFFVCMGFSIIMALVPAGWFFQEVITQTEITDMKIAYETGLTTLILGLILALILLGGNESLKAVAQKHALKRWFVKRKIGAAMIVWVLLILISGASSTWGAYTFTYKSRQAKASDFVKVDSVKNYYEAEIKNANAQVKSLQTSTYKGKRTAQSLSNESKIQDRINNLAVQRDAAILSTGIKNDNIKSAGENDGRGAGAIAAIMAIFIEAALIGLGYYRLSYKWNCELDRRKRNGETTTANNENSINDYRTSTGNYGKVAPSSGIGFHNIPSIKDTNDNRINDNRSAGRICNHCGKSYEHKHHKQEYCDTDCRKAAWEARTGRKLVIKKGGQT